MKKVRLDDFKPYDAPGHFNMAAMRLSGKEETGAQKFWVGLSHFYLEAGPNMLTKIHLPTRYTLSWRGNSP